MTAKLALLEPALDPADLVPRDLLQWSVFDICAGEAVWPGPGDGEEDDEPAQTVRRPATPGRNDPCWCGRGKKYKKCHLGKEGDR